MIARVTIGFVLGLAFSLSFALVPARADQPYGGCDEAWQAPHSAGADHCRSHGWTVRPRVVVGPRGWVRYSSLPSCSVEDASNGPIPCSWNFGNKDGNGYGDAYYVTGNTETRQFHAVRG